MKKLILTLLLGGLIMTGLSANPSTPSTGSGTAGNAGVTNPAGASEGTRRVYRGGGWNDFGKNLRSAYRAALPQNNNAYNVGLRLVCNADDSVKETVTTREAAASGTNRPALRSKQK